MNIDAILERIGEDARQFAARVLDTARENAEKLRVQADEELARAREEARRDAERDAAELRDRMLRMAALEARKDTLAMKREMIDEAFAQALDALRALPQDKARRLHIQLLLEAAGGGEQLAVAEKDAALFDESFFVEANAALEAAGRVGGLRLSPEHRALDGGFVLEQGGMEIDCTYASVLRTRRAALEAEVAAALFG
jgi:V/A-type H+-transporting ATPase subunit E